MNSIRMGAFSGTNRIKEFILPSKIQSIVVYGLESITFDGKSSIYKSVKGVVFTNSGLDHSQSRQIYGLVKHIINPTVPLRSIGENTFMDCRELSKARILVRKSFIQLLRMRSGAGSGVRRRLSSMRGTALSGTAKTSWRCCSNRYFINVDRDIISVGGPKPALLISRAFSLLHCEDCETFASPRMTEPEGERILDVELFQLTLSFSSFSHSHSPRQSDSLNTFNTNPQTLEHLQ